VPLLFGEKLRRTRHLKGLTQAELANRAGLASHGHITNLETSRDVPSLDLAIRVAHILGVSTDYLLRDTIPVEDVSAGIDQPSTSEPGHANQFGAKLRTLRQQQGWGQTELAHRLGLARRGYISNLEAGRKTPSIELVVQIADLFGMTTDALLRNEMLIPPEDTR
jgi:transcriptional regulator with XRE-family HTH domain